jgi:DNA-binding transcriptional LysR family regulator
MGATNDLFAGILPFVHVAEERSFRRAAQRLGVSTAAISKAVLRLEGELGVSLLVRTSRSVTVTPEGEAFLLECREAVRKVSAAREQASDARRRPKGEVHLTTSPVLSAAIVPSLPLLHAKHPGLTFRVTVTDRLVRLVEEGVDVAVRLGAPEDSALVRRLLLEPRWVTVASPRYLSKSAAPDRPDGLNAHACLRFVGPSGRARPWVFRDLATGEARQLVVDGPLLIDEGERLLDAALAGMGVAQVFDFMVAEHLREGRLVEVCAPYAAPGPPIHALFPRERGRSPNVKALVTFLAERFATSTRVP